MQTTNNKLIFACDDNINGLELWVSDGTNLSTFQLKDINSKGSGVYEYSSRYAVSPSGIFFTGISSAEGEELWFTNGTPSGTKIVKDIKVGSQGSYPTSLFYHPGLKLLFFSAYDETAGTELFISDGTSSGTKLLKDLKSGGDSSPFSFAAFNDKVIFTIHGDFDFNSGNTKYETYISDGSVLGTISIHSKPISTGNPRISNYTSLGNRCIFSSFNSLYSTDGTAAGTNLITDKLLIQEAGEFIVFNNKIIFAAADSLHGEELFITDGTKAGTQLLKDINPGLPDASIYNFTILNNKLYFIATTALEGKQVWLTDGTTSGTKIAFRVNQNESSYISNLTVLDKALYFIADDGIRGAELWKYSEEIVAVKDVSDNPEVSIYPNPNDGTMVIHSQELILNLEIMDICGKSYRSFNVNNTAINVNLNLLPGYYLAKLKLKSSKCILSKFVVSN